MPATVPPFGWRVPEGADPPNGPKGFLELAEDISATVVDLRYVGEVRMFAAPTLVPPDWLLCDGASIPVQYPTLIAAIGANTPNLSNRVPMGGGTPLALGGSLTRTLTTANLPAHAHASGTLSATTTGSTHAHSIQRGSAAGSSANTAVRGNVSGDQDGSTRDGGTHTHSITGSTANAGSGTAVDITPAHCRLVFAIYAGAVAA